MHCWHKDVSQELQCCVIPPTGAVRRSEVPPREMAQCVAVTYCFFYNTTQLRQKPHFNHTGNKV